MKISYHILRVGIAITFIWIGILIVKSPDSWIGYLQPWAMKLLFFPIVQALIVTAVLDIIIGILLLIERFTWIAALLGSLHIIIVLTVSGITDITIRDIGLLAGCLAIMIESLPSYFKNYFS